ncbi:hypothetical protein FRB90_000241 [Tulasnella sp. 427]|nr:hypothetical protein FRB90_000241 [Tulasnella sp. 427]
MDLQSARPFTTGDPLSIPEILQRIFQAADRSSLRASACVCQRWSAIALDQLWRSLSSILHLLALLAPRTLISTAGSDPNALIKALVEANWVRFRDYARRVRRISCPKVKEDELSLNCVALIQVFHGASAILPNVKEISWTFWDPKNCLAIIPFLGPRVLDLPPYYLTKEVVAAAARLAHLEALYCDVSPGTEIAYTESGMEFKFTANSFPQLTDVAFAAFAVRMAQVFQVPERIANLNLVDLNCPLGGSAEEIKTIFANLATGAPVLQVIRLRNVGIGAAVRQCHLPIILLPLSHKLHPVGILVPAVYGRRSYSNGEKLA